MTLCIVYQNAKLWLVYVTVHYLLNVAFVGRALTWLTAPDRK